MTWDFIGLVYGEPGSKANQRKIVKFGNKPALIKSEKSRAFGAALREQLVGPDELLEGDLSIRLDVWYASRRPDLSALELVKDLCQGIIYKNDRQVKSEMEVWNLDRKEPRVRIAVRVLPVSGYENLTMHYSLEDMFGE